MLDIGYDATESRGPMAQSHCGQGRGPVVMDGLRQRISYEDFHNLYNMRWSYIFCIVLDGIYMHTVPNKGGHRLEMHS